MTALPAKRCKATTKKGTRCTRVPYLDLKVCLAHAPKEIRESRRFGGAAAGGGRRPIPKPDAMMRQLMADEFMRLHGSHFETLGFGVQISPEGVASLYELPGGGARLHGTSQRDGSINMSEYPDLGARMKAANDLLDRHFGRPKQAIAVTGDGGGPVLLRIGLMFDDRAEQLADELADRLAIEGPKGEER